MSSIVEFKSVSLDLPGKHDVVHSLSFTVRQGDFVAVLGENGAGKTTLLDLMLGFKKPTQGKVLVEGEEPWMDPFKLRHGWIYLSEKMDLPGDWSVAEFFKFNAHFYANYSSQEEQNLIRDFKIDLQQRIGNMSAGEVRRVQIVAGIAARPRLIIVDEITAVLDIIGRHRFMELLKRLNTEHGTTIILATNIIEDLHRYATYIMLVKKGALTAFDSLSRFLKGRPETTLAQCIAERLEET